MAYYSLQDGLGIKLIASGRVGGDALIAANVRFMNEHQQRFLDCSFWFSDYSELDATEVSTETARRIADMALESKKDALVLGTWATSNLPYGMTRMWDAMAGKEGWTLATFRSFEETRKWIGEQLQRSVDLSDGDLIIEISVTN